MRKAGVLAVEAVLLERQGVVGVVLCRAGEVVVLTNGNVDRCNPVATAQVDLLVGIVEVLRVVIAGKTDAITEIADFAAVTKVAVDLQTSSIAAAVAGGLAITDVRGPSAGLESVLLIVDATTG